MFLDPATIRLGFTLKNDDVGANKALKPLSNSPMCFFQRMRVLMKGTLVEDINYLGRVENLFDILLPPQRRRSQSIQMFGDGRSVSHRSRRSYENCQRADSTRQRSEGHGTTIVRTLVSFPTTLDPAKNGTYNRRARD